MPYLPYNLAQAVAAVPELCCEGAALVRTARDIASGLAHLHLASPPIIHRDLKPGNVLVDEHGRAVLCDFGISRRMADAESSAQTRIGTPAYMAPEILAGKPYGAAVDIYAFGMLLYFLGAREPPFAGSDPLAVIFAIVTDGRRPSSAALSLSHPLHELMTSCWAQEPSDRPAVTDLLAVLTAD